MLTTACTVHILRGVNVVCPSRPWMRCQCQQTFSLLLSQLCLYCDHMYHITAATATHVQRICDHWVLGSYTIGQYLVCRYIDGLYFLLKLIMLTWTVVLNTNSSRCAIHRYLQPSLISLCSASFLLECPNFCATVHGTHNTVAPDDIGIDWQSVLRWTLEAVNATPASRMTKRPRSSVRPIDTSSLQSQQLRIHLGVNVSFSWTAAFSRRSAATAETLWICWQYVRTWTSKLPARRQ